MSRENSRYASPYAELVEARMEERSLDLTQSVHRLRFLHVFMLHTYINPDFCRCAVPVTVNGVETSDFLDASEGLVSIDFSVKYNDYVRQSVFRSHTLSF